MTLTPFSFARNCMLNGPVISSARASVGSDLLDSADGRDVKHLRRQHQRRVAAVHAGVLDVLADGTQDDLALVGHGVDLDLARVRLELRHDDRMLRRDRQRAVENEPQLVRLVGDAHRGAGEHVARAHEHRKPAQLRNELLRVRDVGEVRPARLVDAQIVEQGARISCGPPPGRCSRRWCRGCGTPAWCRRKARLFGTCPPMLTTTPNGRSRSKTSITRLEADLVEDQRVAHVVVGADGLGVVVEHDRLVTRAPTRPGSHSRSTSRTRRSSRCGRRPSRAP